MLDSNENTKKYLNQIMILVKLKCWSNLIKVPIYTRLRAFWRHNQYNESHITENYWQKVFENVTWLNSTKTNVKLSLLFYLKTTLKIKETFMKNWCTIKIVYKFYCQRKHILEINIRKFCFKRKHATSYLLFYFFTIICVQTHENFREKNINIIQITYKISSDVSFVLY